MSFGKRLRELRLERGLTQADLSGPGVSRSLVSQLERDRIRPSAQALQTLSEKLGVSYDYLRDAVKPIENTCHVLLKHAWKAIEKGHLEDAFELSDQAVTVATNIGDRELTSQAQLIRGWAFMLKGEPNKGLKDVSQAESRFIKSKSIQPFRVLQAMAMSAFYNDYYGLAESYFESILNMVAPRSLESAVANLHLGLVRQARYGMSAGFAEFSKAVDLSASLGEKHIEAWGICGQITSSIHQKIPIPKEKWTRLRKIINDKDRAISEIYIEPLIAYEQRHHGDYKRAIETLVKFWESRPENDYILSEIAYELSRNYLAIGEYDLAQEVIDKGLNVMPAVRRSYTFIRLWIVQAWIYFYKGQSSTAMNTLKPLLPLARVMSLNLIESHISRWLRDWEQNPYETMHPVVEK